MIGPAALGWLWWTLLPARRRLAAQQLQACLPAAPPGPTLRRALGSAAWGYAELLMGQPLEWRGLEAARGGGLCLTAHFGPWDLAMVRCAEAVPLTVFVKTPSQAWAARALEGLRRRTGADLELLPPAGSMPAAERALERGRLVVFVVDQRHAAGIPVPFFGRPAWSSAGFARLAWRSRAPIVGATMGRGPDGRPWGRMEPLPWAIPEARDEALPALTAAAQAWVEAQVRARPQDWWWLHRRWAAPPAQGQPPPSIR